MSIVQVPCFEINLDLPPEERYLEVFVNYQENIKVIHNKFYKSIPKMRREFFKTLSQVIKKLNNDYYKEMEAMANIIGEDVEKCIAVDHVCEATTGCTSIISRMMDEATGEMKMVHGRNLDYPVEVPTMRKSLYKAIFKKDALVFAGFQGIYTGIKKGAYSISYNLRNKTEKDGFIKSMVLAYLGYNKWSKIIQDTFVNCETFEEAAAYLQDTPAINNCYLTLCGTDRGVKITKDRFKSRLNWVYANGDEETEPWYDCQTNCDTWEDPPPRDNNRLNMAKEMMDLTGLENITEKRMLYNVLHIYPVCNKETVYCAFMDPSDYRCTIMIPDDNKCESESDSPT